MPPGDLATPLSGARSGRRRPLTVVHLLHTIAYGGVETIIINWLRALDPERVDAHVVCFANPGRTEAPFLAMAGRARLSVRTIAWSRRKPILRAARALARILREVKADIVHTHNVYADAVGLVAARRTGAKAVASLFVWSDFGWKRNLLQWLDQWVLRGFDLVTTQCEQTRQDSLARGLSPERTRVLISGFENPPALPAPEERERRRRELGIQEHELILASVARLYPEKAHDVLLRSFASLRTRCPQARLWIFGTGPLEASLRSQCHELGLDGEVRFLGFAPDLLDRLPLLDLQVHPSHAEGVPLSLCSGMAAGLPVVASAVGGVPELLGSGRHGRLLPPAGDAGFTDAFSEAVLRLASHPEERRAVGAAGRSFIATEYSMKTAVETLENAYLRLVG